MGSNNVLFLGRSGRTVTERESERKWAFITEDLAEDTAKVCIVFFSLQGKPKVVFIVFWLFSADYLSPYSYLWYVWHESRHLSG